MPIISVVWDWKTTQRPNYDDPFDGLVVYGSWEMGDGRWRECERGHGRRESRDFGVGRWRVEGGVSGKDTDGRAKMREESVRVRRRAALHSLLFWFSVWK